MTANCSAEPPTRHSVLPAALEFSPEATKWTRKRHCQPLVCTLLVEKVPAMKAAHRVSFHNIHQAHSASGSPSTAGERLRWKSHAAQIERLCHNNEHICAHHNKTGAEDYKTSPRQFQVCRTKGPRRRHSTLHRRNKQIKKESHSGNVEAHPVDNSDH